MKRVIVDICNSLLSMSIVNALQNTGNFEVHLTNCEDEWIPTDIALLEAAYTSGFTIEESLSKAARLHRTKPGCKIMLICDENSAPELARKVLQSKIDGKIDDFVYSSVSESYLLAMLESM